MRMLFFTEDEIRQCVQMNDEVILEIESAFTDLSCKKVQMPPTMRIDIPNNNGEVVLKTAYIPGFEMFALKVSSHFFHNYNIKLPSTGGLMMLMNALNGKPEAFFYDNGYLTDVRTAAAGAIAAKYMSRKDIRKVGVIGTGTQARHQLLALKQVRDFNEVYVLDRKSTRLNSSHVAISYAVFCLKKKKKRIKSIVKSIEFNIKRRFNYLHKSY